MKTKKLSVNTICVRCGYTPKNGEPIEGFQANAEDAEVVEAYRLAFQQQLTHTNLHFDQHAADCGLTEHAVMVCHVLYEFLKLHKFGNGAAVPLVFGYARLIAFVLLVTYHTICV